MLGLVLGLGLGLGGLGLGPRITACITDIIVYNGWDYGRYHCRMIG